MQLSNALQTFFQSILHGFADNLWSVPDNSLHPIKGTLETTHHVGMKTPHRMWYMIKEQSRDYVKEAL